MTAEIGHDPLRFTDARGLKALAALRRTALRDTQIYEGRSESGRLSRWRLYW